MSMRDSARVRVRCCLSSSSFLRCNKSPTSQSSPKPSKIPIKGGNPVKVLKTGTATSVPKPMKNMVLRSRALVATCSLLPSIRAGGTTGLPRKTQAMTANGTSMLAIEAMNTPFMMAAVVT